MKQAIAQFKSELHAELLNILAYWTNNTQDLQHGGFYGRIDSENQKVTDASKGIILNTRILWSFSAASNYLQSNEHGAICDRAYRYIKDYFVDAEQGGVFWEVDYLGGPLNKRKQVYAQAFAMYAFSEYYEFSKKTEAQDLAVDLFRLIEKYSYDKRKDGYLEALSEDWGRLDDMRLSEKDMNTSKTMNTHLHILEAYTRLLQVCDGEKVRKTLKSLVELFNEKFLSDAYNYHLFFDDDWSLQSQVVSFGHDIEAAWLVLEAAKAVGDEGLIEKCSDNAIKIADAFLKDGLNGGAVLNEKDLKTGEADTDRHWWPQVEAMIGLAYVYNLTKEEKYIQTAIDIWQYVKGHLLDKENGEWYFRVNEQGVPYGEDKVSMWKAPYHTTRACMVLNEIL